VIIHFGDPGTRICGGKSYKTSIGISGLQRLGYQESRGQEIRNLQGENPELNQSRPFVETRGGNRVTQRYIGYWGFELIEEFCHRGIRMSRNHERRSGLSILKGRVAASEAFGKGPDRRATSEKSGIGISRILWTKCLCISALRCPKPR
jgi:hypothetical protein